MNSCKLSFYPLLLSLLLFASEVKSQLMVDTTATKEQLVEMLVDKGVYYENVQLTCPGVAKGIFSHPNDQSNLSLGEGIILTTGKGINAMGSNTGKSESTNNYSSLKDADLAQLAGSSVIRDKCILEFDIIPVGNEISFNYVFGSEEYPKYVGSQFNDVFGFFVSGPGIKGPFEGNAQNIAVVGPQKLPVAVNTVNSGVAPSKYKEKTESSSFKGSLGLSHLYNDNTPINPRSIQYNGFTKKLQAKIKVIPCKKYHFKLAISDVGDGIVDTGVFIEKNSFKSNNYYAEKIVAASSCDIQCKGVVGLNILDGKPENYNITWNIDGKSTTGGIKKENLCPGTNIIAVVEPVNGGCEQSININIPEALSISAKSIGSDSSSTCSGSIALNITGGVPPYRYSWSNGKTDKDLTDLCPGKYSVTVKDANRCEQIIDFEIPKGADLVAEVSRGGGLLNPVSKELVNLINEKNTILFEQNEANVKAAFFSYLRELAGVLKRDTSLKVELIGHASSEGSSYSNMQLSKKRASRVKEFLVKLRVEPSQIEVSAKGEDKLYQPETSEDDRKQNRRVEVAVKN